MMKNKAAIALAIVAVGLGAAHAARAEQLQVALVSRTVFYAPVWVADQRGYLRDEGIDAKFLIYDNVEKINDDLHAGKVQVSISTPESVIVDAYNGGTLRIVAGNAEKLPHSIIAKSSIKTLADLKGARFGVLSLQEGTTYLVKQVAQSAGLKPTDYSVEQVGGAPTRWKLLQEGKIDVGLQPFPLSYQATDAGFTDLGPVAKYVPDYQFTSVNVDDKWASAHASLVSGFLRALRRGQDDLAKDPEYAAAVAAKELDASIPLTKRALEDTSRLKILSADLSVSTPGLQSVFTSLVDGGSLPKASHFDQSRFVNETYLNGSRSFTISELGSFFVGGGSTTVSGQPVRSVQYAKDAPPLKLDPNGTYASGQIYVQYVKLARPSKKYPIIFLNGGTSTGSMWESTPDGRPGWQLLALRAGYSTYLTDAVGKGRASWSKWPEVFKDAPAFRPNEETWPLLRIGPKYTQDPAGRQAFENSAFPVDYYDDFAKSAVPRFPGQDKIELQAYEALIEKVCPCIFVTQSSGGYFATQLALGHPKLVKAIVTAELTATPDLSPDNLKVLSNVPQLILWGDNWQSTATWSRIRSQVDRYLQAVDPAHRKVVLIDLPTRGLVGNTHQMMSDRTNGQVFKLGLDWLDALSAVQ